jgi:FlaG/FlaF family flagellin (archaellin)
MVAITVILAAVIGTFVLGLGENLSNTAPQAQLSVDASAASNELNITHDGGDTLQSSDTRIIITIADNDQITFDAAGSATLSVGGQTGIVTDTGSASTVNSGAFSGAYGPGSNNVDMAAGDTVEVRLIDTESQQTIFRTEITA